MKMPIDLNVGKNAFGNKQGFNVQNMLFAIPKLIVPLGLYGLGNYFINPLSGYLLVVAAGILGFAFRDKVFSIIEKTYKSEKYKTINAYAQNE